MDNDAPSTTATDPATTPGGPDPTAPAASPAGPLEQGLEELLRAFGPRLGEDDVRRIVFESFEDLALAGTDDGHREALAVRFARARLDALAELEGAATRNPAVARVLFVCVQNAGRSQLAAALLAERAGDAVQVASAGSCPSSHVHATVVPVLDQLGADPALTFPKPVAPEVLHAADYVVTMGCGDSVEAGEDAVVLDWPVGDPAEADEEQLRRIVADIEARVDALWAEIQARQEHGGHATA